MSSTGAAVLTIIVLLVAAGVVTAIVLYLKKEAALKNATMQYNATTKTWTGSFTVVNNVGATVTNLFVPPLGASNYGILSNLINVGTALPFVFPDVKWSVPPTPNVQVSDDSGNYTGTVPSAFSTVTITTTSASTVTPATGTIVFT